MGYWGFFDVWVMVLAVSTALRPISAHQQGLARRLTLHLVIASSSLALTPSSGFFKVDISIVSPRLAPFVLPSVLRADSEVPGRDARGRVTIPASDPLLPVIAFDGPAASGVCIVFRLSSASGPFALVERAMSLPSGVRWGGNEVDSEMDDRCVGDETWLSLDSRVVRRPVPDPSGEVAIVTCPRCVAAWRSWRCKRDEGVCWSGCHAESDRC